MRVLLHDCRHDDRVFARGACDNARRYTLCGKEAGKRFGGGEGITLAVPGMAVRPARGADQAFSEPA